MEKTCLLDLPVYPEDRDGACGTSTIMDTYLAERDAIKSGDELQSFVIRWRNLWLLSDNYDKLSEEEKALIDDEIDHDKVYVQLLRKKEDNLPFEDINVKIMSHIAMPIPFLQAFRVSQHWGVGSDLAMVRLYLDPFPQYNDAMRYGSGDPRPGTVKKIMDE